MWEEVEGVAMFGRCELGAVCVPLSKRQRLNPLSGADTFSAGGSIDYPFLMVIQEETNTLNSKKDIS